VLAGLSFRYALGDVDGLEREGVGEGLVVGDGIAAVAAREQYADLGFVVGLDLETEAQAEPVAIAVGIALPRKSSFRSRMSPFERHLAEPVGKRRQHRRRSLLLPGLTSLASTESMTFLLLEDVLEIPRPAPPAHRSNTLTLISTFFIPSSPLVGLVQGVPGSPESPSPVWRTSSARRYGVLSWT